MGWLQSRTVDSTGNIGTSGTATQWNDFVTNGYLVPRTGVYQISAYQSIKAKSHNCGFTGTTRCSLPRVDSAAAPGVSQRPAAPVGALTAGPNTNYVVAY